MNLQDLFTQFFNTWNGKPCEVNDPTNKNQCMDLAYAWIDMLKIPRETIGHLYAYQVYTQPKDSTRQYFDLIPNTPTGVPQLGDLVVFGTKVGIAGHICISTGKGNTNQFESFDQNWNGKQYGTLVQHNYNGVLGWLYPKNVVPAPEMVNKTEFKKKIIDFINSL